MIHPHDRKWIDGLLHSTNLSHKQRAKLMHKYVEVAQEQGRRAANTGLRMWLQNNHILTTNQINDITVSVRRCKV